MLSPICGANRLFAVSLNKPNYGFTMLEKLKQKWKVNGRELFLILCVFAITGTTAAWLTRQITSWLELESSSAWYWILKIAVLLVGYPLILIIVGALFGQFRFFSQFVLKMFGIRKKRN